MKCCCCFWLCIVCIKCTEPLAVDSPVETDVVRKFPTSTHVCFHLSQDSNLRPPVQQPYALATQPPRLPFFHNVNKIYSILTLTPYCTCVHSFTWNAYYLWKTLLFPKKFTSPLILSFSLGIPNYILPHIIPIPSFQVFHHAHYLLNPEL